MRIGLGLGLGLGGQRAGAVSYLMRDAFTTDRAAGAVHGTAAEPGGTGGAALNTRTVVDTESRLTIGTGKLLVAGGKASPAYGDPGLWYGPVARAAGLCFACVFKPDATNAILAIGLDSNQSGAAYDQIAFTNTGSLNAIEAAGTLATIARSYLAVPYNVALVARAAGLFLIWKQESATDWELHWVGVNSSAATVYPAILGYSAAGYVDDARLLQLAGPWATDYGLATTRVEAPSSPATATGEDDGFIEFTWTPAADEVLELSVRRTDDDNRWIVRCDQAGGTAKLVERNAGVETQRATATQTWTAGTAHRITVRMVDAAIIYRVGNTYKNQYASANFNKTASGMAVAGFATGSNLIAWPGVVPSPFDYRPTTRTFVGWGDSKTDGDNYQAPLLASLNADTGLTWYQAPGEMGRPGWTVALWQAQIDADLAAAGGAPNYVLCNIGSNDIASVNPAVDAEVWKSNLAYILDAMHARWPRAQVYVMRIWRRLTNGQMNDLNDVWIPAVLAGRSSWAYLGPDERVFLENGDDGVTYTADGIHPNEAGYALTAAQWRARLGY